MHDRWQLQEAKQRFSELIRSEEADGPQYVTRHGEEVAVVVSISEYRQLREGDRDFKRVPAVRARRRPGRRKQARLAEWAGRQPPSAVDFHCDLRSRSISSGGRTPIVRTPASIRTA